MRKKAFMKVMAIIACLCILSLSAPNVMAAERSVKKFDFKIFVKKSALMFTSLFSFLNPISDTGKAIKSYDKNSNSSGKIKALGGLMSGKPSTGD